MRRSSPPCRLAAGLLASLACSSLPLALGLSQEAPTAPARVPGPTWDRYVDPAEAGFDSERLEAARASWEALPSSAFLVISGGAVVAAWGDVERRFLCHSVRKSFLAALYGIYWDRGELELNKTLADLGIDDEPLPLLETERRARILDLLKARSGVFHPAAYAGRTDSRPRGSEGPGRYFAYNNWDFNTLATILMQETGDDVFEAFDASFGQPLQMQDWRVSDGYYHYERDKSIYPAYPFRMSARDAARFGLLFARRGAWGDEQILSRHWVARCGGLYSIDSDVWGYGFMWWVARQPRFERHGLIAALGVGNQMIAALPESDLVIVNRANTYRGESTPDEGLLDLVEEVLAARTGTPSAAPTLTPLEPDAPAPQVVLRPEADLLPFVGTHPTPAPGLGLPPGDRITVTVADGHLVADLEFAGSFDAYLQDNGWWWVEDVEDLYVPRFDEVGALLGLTSLDDLLGLIGDALARRDDARAQALLNPLAEAGAPAARAGLALTGLWEGEDPMPGLEALTRELGGDEVESLVNAWGYRLLEGDAERAFDLLALNADLFPEAPNVWDSLGEVNLALGRREDALACYELALELDPSNQAAASQVERLRRTP